jgi:DNA polymerase I-like protein with 3'-5' exonuclease and polymerase domains
MCRGSPRADSLSLPSFLENLDPDIYFSDNYVVVDFEVDTSHGDYGHPVHPDNQLLLACWRLGPAHPWMSSVTQAKWGNELEQSALVQCIEKAEFIIAHNAKYELGWLKRMGMDLHDILPFDTKLGEYVLLGNLAAGSKDLGMHPLSTSLDMCCRRRGLPIKDPVVDIMIGHGINPVRIPRPWLEGRCRQDVETTEAVFLSQRDELRSRGLLPVQFTRCLLTPVLAEIEQEGMAVDPEVVEQEYAKTLAKAQELQKQMDEITGGINIRSCLQAPEFLYDKLGFRELTNKRGEPKRTPVGGRLYDSDTIQELVPHNAKQRRFQELHKELSKANALLSKNLEFFRGICEEYNGVFYGEISQTSTATHRTASRGVPLTFTSQLDDKGKPITRRVQFQNFPRLLKKVFRAKRDGWLFAEPDGSQIEFRCAAVLGNDEQAIADIIDTDFDAHVQTASILHNCTKEEVIAEKKAAQEAGRDDWRQLAKPDTYKPLYGGKYGTKEQERYYTWFREHYSGISGIQDKWVNEAVETKRQRTPWGLVYYWPTARRGYGGRVNAETAIDNYPIQALATAEIVPIAVVYLWHRLREAGIDHLARIINLVHDSAPTEVHPSVIETYKQIAKRTFTADVYEYLDKVYKMDFSRVPLGVGLKVGEHWGEGLEESWDVYKDSREVKRK